MSEKSKPLTPAEAKRELDRLFKFLLTHQMPMAPDPEPPVVELRRLRPKNHRR